MCRGCQTSDSRANEMSGLRAIGLAPSSSGACAKCAEKPTFSGAHDRSIACRNAQTDTVGRFDSEQSCNHQIGKPANACDETTSSERAAVGMTDAQQRTCGGPLLDNDLAMHHGFETKRWVTLNQRKRLGDRVTRPPYHISCGQPPRTGDYRGDLKPSRTFRSAGCVLALRR